MTTPRAKSVCVMAAAKRLSFCMVGVEVVGVRADLSCAFVTSVEAACSRAAKSDLEIFQWGCGVEGTEGEELRLATEEHRARVSHIVLAMWSHTCLGFRGCLLVGPALSCSHWPVYRGAAWEELRGEKRAGGRTSVPVVGHVLRPLSRRAHPHCRWIDAAEPTS